MRAKMIAAGVVLALIIALSFFSLCVVKRDTTALRQLADRAVAAVEAGDDELGMALVNELLAQLDTKRPLLEVLTLHEAINRVSESASEARLRLKYGQKEEFSSTMARLLDRLTVLYEQQRPSLSNLF